MTIQLPPELERAVAEQARRQNTTPEALVVDVLRQRLLPTAAVEKESFVPRDEWEALVLSMGKDYGVSLSNEDVSSEGLYD